MTLFRISEEASSAPGIAVLSRGWKVAGWPQDCCGFARRWWRACALNAVGQGESSSSSLKAVTAGKRSLVDGSNLWVERFCPKQGEVKSGALTRGRRCPPYGRDTDAVSTPPRPRCCCGPRQEEFLFCANKTHPNEKACFHHSLGARCFHLHSLLEMTTQTPSGPCPACGGLPSEGSHTDIQGACFQDTSAVELL